MQQPHRYVIDKMGRRTFIESFNDYTRAWKKKEGKEHVDITGTFKEPLSSRWGTISAALKFVLQHRTDLVAFWSHLFETTPSKTENVLKKVAAEAAIWWECPLVLAMVSDGMG